MQTFSYYVKNPSQFFYSVVLKFKRLFPDKLYLKIIFRLNMGNGLNLKKPQTFSEKLQWIKLYDHNPLYTTMVDKYKVKDYVRNILGDDYVIPLLGVWDKVDDIEWDRLPNQFVVKANHDSQGVVICKDKSKFDIFAAKKKLSKSLKRNYFYNGREWPYKNVEKKIFAEKYIEEKNGDLNDYKFFCFNGIPRYCQVISDRQTNMSIDFFDRQWNHQPFHEPKNYPFALKLSQKPHNYELMWQYASKLSKGIPFVRIDFYNVDGQIYFGEITFFPTGGMGGFSPNEWDKKFGDYIKLPIDK